MTDKRTMTNRVRRGERGLGSQPREGRRTDAGGGGCSHCCCRHHPPPRLRLLAAQTGGPALPAAPAKEAARACTRLPILATARVMSSSDSRRSPSRCSTIRARSAVSSEASAAEPPPRPASTWSITARSCRTAARSDDEAAEEEEQPLPVVRRRCWEPEEEEPPLRALLTLAELLLGGGAMGAAAAAAEGLSGASSDESPLAEPLPPPRRRAVSALRVLLPAPMSRARSPSASEPWRESSETSSHSDVSLPLGVQVPVGVVLSEAVVLVTVEAEPPACVCALWGGVFCWVCGETGVVGWGGWTATASVVGGWCVYVYIPSSGSSKTNTAAERAEQSRRLPRYRWGFPLPDGAPRRTGTPPLKAALVEVDRRVSLSKQRLRDWTLTAVTEGEGKRNLTRRRQIFCVSSSSGVLFL